MSCDGSRRADCCRLRTAWTDNVKGWTGLPVLEQAGRSTADRKSRRASVSDAAIEDGTAARGKAGSAEEAEADERVISWTSGR